MLTRTRWRGEGDRGECGGHCRCAGNHGCESALPGSTKEHQRLERRHASKLAESGDTAQVPSARVKRPSPLVVLVLAGVVGLLGLLAYGVASEDEDGGSALVGEQAPDIRLPPLDGGPEKSLSDWRGQVVVLNYWASWCEPCREESPLLERWHRKISKRGGTILGVDSLDVTDDAKAFIERYKLTYPHLRDKDGSTQEDFGVTGYPETFVIDREGVIAAFELGPVDEEFLSEAVLPLLREN